MASSGTVQYQPGQRWISDSEAELGLGTILTAVIGGRLSDRSGRRKVFVIVASVVMGLSVLILAAVPDFTAACIGAFLLGTGYGVYLAVATGVWFCMVAMLFSHQRVRTGFARMGHWFDRTMGAVLVALGVKLAFTEMH